MAPHSSTLAWKIPLTEEPGRLPSMGSHRVGHDWSDLAAAVPEWEEWRNKTKKNIWRNNGQISSTFDKNSKAPNQEVQQTPSLRNIRYLGTSYYKCLKQMIKRS